jgi:hypothetical protein
MTKHPVESSNVVRVMAAKIILDVFMGGPPFELPAVRRCPIRLGWANSPLDLSSP